MDIESAVRDMIFQALAGGIRELGKGSPTAALAGLCTAFGVDITLLDIPASSSGRVLAEMGRLTASTIREDVWRCGAIQIIPTTALNAVPAVQVVFEPDLPDQMQAALVLAGVEQDVLASLYFDERHGQTFRQRIKSKWQTFTDLVSKGLIHNPTGFFVAAVRRNWHLSGNYEPGKKTAPKAVSTPSGPVLPPVGAVVRVAGDLERECRVLWHRLTGGEWRTAVEDVLDGAESVISSRKLRVA